MNNEADVAFGSRTSYRARFSSSARRTVSRLALPASIAYPSFLMVATRRFCTTDNQNGHKRYTDAEATPCKTGAQKLSEFAVSSVGKATSYDVARVPRPRSGP